MNSAITLNEEIFFYVLNEMNVQNEMIDAIWNGNEKFDGMNEIKKIHITALHMMAVGF